MIVNPCHLFGGCEIYLFCQDHWIGWEHLHLETPWCFAQDSRGRHIRKRRGAQGADREGQPRGAGRTGESHGKSGVWMIGNEGMIHKSYE